MTRRASRITHDEVARLVKAVRSLGLPIARVSYDGERVDVVIGEPPAVEPALPPAGAGLLREPRP